MISFWNFPFACLPTEADQSLGTCVCFLHFCFCFFSWSVTEQNHYSGSNKKLSLECLQKKSQLMLSIWHMLGVCCCYSLPSFFSFIQLVFKVAVAQGMHIVRCQHRDEISFYLPCKRAHCVISSFSLFLLASKRD